MEWQRPALASGADGLCPVTPGLSLAAWLACQRDLSPAPLVDSLAPALRGHSRIGAEETAEGGNGPGLGLDWALEWRECGMGSGSRNSGVSAHSKSLTRSEQGSWSAVRVRCGEGRTQEHVVGRKPKTRMVSEATRTGVSVLPWHTTHLLLFPFWEVDDDTHQPKFPEETERRSAWNAVITVNGEEKRNMVAQGCGGLRLGGITDRVCKEDQKDLNSALLRYPPAYYFVKEQQKDGAGDLVQQQSKYFDR